ncbi:MAG TPA: hypothetical protein PLV92_25755, partial [Pirellulaceae bacterium]|nr:hypothetical protein [Pirellulaceae bacterium]
MLGFCLSLDRPLCVVGRKHSHNHFESLETIGGAVLKGAVARLLLETTGAAAAGRRFVEPGLAGFEALSKNFAALRFTEARPVEHGAGRRPVEPPLSIVVASQRQGEFFDVALCDKPCLIDDEAPAFQPDWKPEHFALVRGKFGWPEVPRERRTRTAIEPPTGRAADERLFSYGLVLPESVLSDGSMKKLQWLAAIGLDDVAIEERPRVADELSRLLAFGLPH